MPVGVDAHRVDPSPHVAAGIGGVSLADLRQRVRVSQRLESLLQLRQFLRADQDRSRVPFRVGESLPF